MQQDHVEQMSDLFVEHC